jgi:replicative DNA helicase
LIIGATTGTGKSSFLLNLMEGFMNDYQCIYFNMEMSKSTIYKRLISIKANMPIKDVLNPQTNEDKEKVLKAAEDIERAGIVVEHKSTGMRDIRSVVVKNKKPDKHTLVFIDHLGLTRSENSKNSKSLYEQMTEVAKDIRQMCLEEDCTVIGASQFNREAYSTDDYSLAMLKDSGELENSASKVIFIHRPKDNEGKIVTNVELNLEIAKNRDGMLGFIKMEYDKEKQIFRERYD